MSLFDIMQAAIGGEAFARTARQFGMSATQVEQAMGAFMPAFSAGLRTSTADPFGFAEFMRKLAAGDFARAYRQPDWAFGAGRKQGEEALAFMFGSPELVRALVEQASKATGLAQARLAEFLPGLAAMTFGGLATQGAARNPFLDAMMAQFAPPAAESEAAAPGEGPLDRLEREQKARAASATAAMSHAQSETMKAGLAAMQAGTAAWQQAFGAMMKQAGVAMPGGTKQDDAAAPGENPFAAMLEPGIRLSEAYQREVEAMVARMAKPPKG